MSNPLHILTAQIESIRAQLDVMIMVLDSMQPKPAPVEAPTPERAPKFTTFDGPATYATAVPARPVLPDAQGDLSPVSS